MRRLVKVLCAVMAAGATAAPASAGAVTCGAVITEDVVLHRSLTGCDAGLVVAADGVTLDLGGHVIAGTGAPGAIGIHVQGGAGVSIEHGAIRGFERGVLLDEATDSGVDRIVVTRAALTGISLRRTQRATVTRSVVTGSGTGIEAYFGDALIDGNVVARNRAGIFAAFGSGAIRRNVASANGGDGVSLVRHRADVEGNVAAHNGGTGIRSDDSHGRYARNVVTTNGGHGMLVTDQLPDHGQFFSADRNLALANAGVGLTVPPGTTDGGRNRARANGGPEQCVNLACR